MDAILGKLTLVEDGTQKATRLHESVAELERRERVARPRDVGGGDAGELDAGRAGERLHRAPRFLGLAGRDHRRRHRDDLHLVGIALANAEIGAFAAGRKPQVGAEGEHGHEQQEEEESGHFSRRQR